MSDPSTGMRDQRLDSARGVAVIAMVVYHLVWDLAFFGFIDPATATAPGFRRLGAMIAGAFLLMAGISLVLARQTMTDDAQFRSKFLRRLAIIVGAAALVSLGTWLAMGDRYVRFGILHCIAAASVIALPFLRLPALAAAAAGAVVLALPWLVDLPAMSHPALLWAGLSTRTPAMVDYVPIFPFAGMTLLGVAAGRVMGGRTGTSGGDGWLPRLGRLSLPVYLIHQPVLYGVLFLLASLTATSVRPPSDPSADRDTIGFRLECRRACEGQGNAKGHCDRYCTCAETEMKSSGAWTRAMTDPGGGAIQSELAPMLQACFSKTRDGG